MGPADRPGIPRAGAASDEGDRDVGCSSGILCVEAARHLLIKAMDVLRRVPALREYVTQSIYTILRKPATAS